MKNAKNIGKEKLKIAYQLHQLVKRIDGDRHSLIKDKINLM